MQKVNCENSISKEVFEKEIAMCKKLNGKNGEKCNWGKCEECGVIPMLHKIYKGELYEDEDEIEDLRRSILG